MTFTVTCPHAGCREQLEVEASVYGRKQYTVEDLGGPDECPESGPLTDEDYLSISYVIGEQALDAYYERKHEDRS